MRREEADHRLSLPAPPEERRPSARAWDSQTAAAGGTDMAEVTRVTDEVIGVTGGVMGVIGGVIGVTGE